MIVAQTSTKWARNLHLRRTSLHESETPRLWGRGSIVEGRSDAVVGSARARVGDGKKLCWLPERLVRMAQKNQMIRSRFWLCTQLSCTSSAPKLHTQTISNTYRISLPASNPPNTVRPTVRSSVHGLLHPRV